MTGPPVRESYNAKARQSTAGSRKKGKRKKNITTEASDPNADIIEPKSREDKDKEQKDRLLQEVS